MLFYNSKEVNNETYNDILTSGDESNINLLNLVREIGKDNNLLFSDLYVEINHNSNIYRMHYLKIKHKDNNKIFSLSDKYLLFNKFSDFNDTYICWNDKIEKSDESLIQINNENMHEYILCQSVEGDEYVFRITEKLHIEYEIYTEVTDISDIEIYIYSKDYVKSLYSDIYLYVFFPLEKVYSINYGYIEMMFVGYNYVDVTNNYLENGIKNIYFCNNYIYDTDNIYCIINKLYDQLINMGKNIKKSDIYLYNNDMCLTHKLYNYKTNYNDNEIEIDDEKDNEKENSDSESEKKSSKKSSTTGTDMDEKKKKRKNKNIKITTEVIFPLNPEDFELEINKLMMIDLENKYVKKICISNYHHNIYELVKKSGSDEKLSFNLYLRKNDMDIDMDEKLELIFNNVYFPRKNEDYLDNISNKTVFATCPLNRYDNVLSIYNEMKQYGYIHETSRLMNYNKGIMNKIRNINDINVLSLVCQLNFNNTDDFINLDLIFDQFKLSRKIPFIKFKRGKDKESYFKVHKTLVSNKKLGIKGDITEAIMKSWIAKNSLKDNKDIIGNRGLTFKIALDNPDDIHSVSDKNVKYMTINLFTSGRLEIKTQTNSDNYDNMLLNKVKNNIIEFIDKINMIEYQMIGFKNKKIVNIPENYDILSNNESYSFNTFLEFETLNENIKYMNIMKKIFSKFSSIFSIIDDNIYQSDDEDEKLTITRFNVRYKLADNFYPESSIILYIKDFLSTDSNPDEFKKNICDIFKVTDLIAEKHIELYNKMLENKYIDGSLNRLFNTEKQGTFIRIKKITDETTGTINIMGIRSIEQYRNVIKFLDLMFIIEELYDNINIEENIIKEKLVNDILTKISIEDDDDDDNSEKIVKEYKKKYETHTLATNKGDKLKLIEKVLNIPPTFKYPRSCEKARQPWVVSIEKSEMMKNDIEKRIDKAKTNLFNDKSLENQEIFDSYNEIKKVLDNGNILKDNFFFCPNYYNYEDKKIISTREYEKMIKNGESIKNIEKSKIGNNLLGISKSQNINDECLPCCFNKISNESIGMIEKCKTKIDSSDEESTINSSTTNEINMNNTNYILSENKKLKIGRFGLLPKNINDIFNNGMVFVNEMGDNFNGYLRIRIDHNFLRTVLRLKKIEFNTFIDNVNKLTENEFKSFKNGIVYNIFKGTENTSFQNTKTNFINYIKTTKNLSEELLWDLCNKMLKCNIIIFEKNQENNIILKCPIGNNVNGFYDDNFENIVMYKFSEKSEKNHIFDVICHVDYNNKIKYNGLFNNDEIFIEIKNRIINQCNEKRDDIPYYERKTLSTKKDMFSSDLEYMNINDDIFDYYTYIQHLLEIEIDEDEDEFYPVYQILDDYNKITYIILKNDLLLPIKSTSIIQREYKNINVPEIIEIRDAHNYLNDYETAKELLNKLSLKIYQYKIKMCIAYDRNDVKYITGFLLNNGLNVPIKEIKYEEIVDKDEFKIYTRNYDNDINVDLAISANDIIDTNNPKFLINCRKIEDETMQRIRYEFSKYILYNEIECDNHCKSIKSDIKEIIDNIELNNNEKRKLLRPIINEIFIKIVYIVNEIPEIKEIINYEIPNIRISCINNQKNTQDFHCIKDENDDGKYKVKVYKTNLEYNFNENNKSQYNSNNEFKYKSLLIEELIKNKWGDLINNNIDSITNIDYLTKHDDEFIINNNSYEKSKQQINQLYNPKDPMVKISEEHYDVLNPDNMNSNIKYKKIDLTAYWFKYLGGNFKCIEVDEKKYSKNFLQEILNIYNTTKKDTLEYMNYNDIKQEIINEIKSYTYKNNISNKLFIKYYRSIFPGKVTKNIQTDHDLFKYIEEDYYNISILDIMMLSKILEIKFIILRKYNASEHNNFLCIENTYTQSKNIVLLYMTKTNFFHVIGDVSKDPIKKIFNANDLPKEFMKIWDQKCTKDNLDRNDEKYNILHKNDIKLVQEIIDIDGVQHINVKFDNQGQGQGQGQQIILDDDDMNELPNNENDQPEIILDDEI